MYLLNKLFSVIFVLTFYATALSAGSDCPESFCNKVNWVSNPVAGISTIQIDRDSIALVQKGCITHRNQWAISNISFDVRFEQITKASSGYLFIIQFAKARRNSFFGETHNRGTVNDSYGLAFNNRGVVQLVRFGKENTVDTIGESIAIDLLRENRIELEMSNAHQVACFALSVNGLERKVFTDQSPFFLTGYISMLNPSVGVKSCLSNIEVDGVEIEFEDNVSPSPVYFLDYFEEQNERFIHWRYNERTQDYIGVNIYDNDKLIDSLDYPSDKFVLPNSFKAKELVVKTIDVDGDESDGVFINLAKKTRSSEFVSPQKIKVKRKQPYAELVNEQTSEIFNVRGVNYVRLTFGDHSNFTAKNEYLPNLYDPYDAETVFRVLKKAGFNTVRVFLAGRGVLNPGIGGYPEFNEAVYKPYLDNFVDFLSRAQKYGMYVLPTFGDGELPLNAYYKPYLKKMADMTKEPEQLVSGFPFNSVYLTEVGIEGRELLISKTLEYIKQKDASLLKSILAVQCQNELSLRADQWPFNLNAGTVVCANGKTYDMSDVDSRQLCMDEGLNYYHQRLIKVIKSVDSDLLVAEGAFTLRIVGKDPGRNKGLIIDEHADQRFPPTALVMGNSGLDLIDIHIYYVNNEETPVEGYTNDMRSMLMYTEAMRKVRASVPVIMGEFGSFNFIEPSYEQAKANILSTRDACLNDNFNGFMIWTLDSFEQQEMFNVMDGGLKFLKELGGL